MFNVRCACPSGVACDIHNVRKHKTVIQKLENKKTFWFKEIGNIKIIITELVSSVQIDWF